jgi:hypothetical protein
MPLQFGLLHSNLFPSSEAAGEGLGGDPQQGIIKSNKLGTQIFAGATSVTFEGFDAKRIQIVFRCFNEVDGAIWYMRFNGNSSALYEWTNITDGAAAKANTQTAVQLMNTGSGTVHVSGSALVQLGSDGVTKHAMVDGQIHHGGSARLVQFSGDLRTSVTNITSIEVFVDQANGMSGAITVLEVQEF